MTKERTPNAAKASRSRNSSRTVTSVSGAKGTKPKRTSASVERSKRDDVRNKRSSTVRQVHNGTRSNGSKRQRGSDQANGVANLRKTGGNRRTTSAKAKQVDSGGVKRTRVTTAKNATSKAKQLIDKNGHPLKVGDHVRFHSYRGTTLQATVHEPKSLGDMISILIKNDPYPTFVDYHQVEINKEKSVPSKAVTLRKQASALKIPDWESMDADELEVAIAEAEGNETSADEEEEEEPDEEDEDDIEEPEVEEEDETEEDDPAETEDEAEVETPKPRSRNRSTSTKKREKKAMPTKRTRTRSKAATTDAPSPRKRTRPSAATETPRKRARTATEAPARARAAKKGGSRPAKRVGAPRPPREYEGPNPFAPGSNNYLITEALIKGGKRSTMVTKLANKLKYNPRVHVSDFDPETETKKRVLAVSYYLKNQLGWDREITGRGETSTIKCTPA